MLLSKFLHDSAGAYGSTRREPMKNVIRLVVLMLGLATTYVALAAPMLPAPDGGPLPLCNPKTGCGPQGF
jgi:hypothetical protein